MLKHTKLYKTLAFSAILILGIGIMRPHAAAGPIEVVIQPFLDGATATTGYITTEMLFSDVQGSKNAYPGAVFENSFSIINNTDSDYKIVGWEFKDWVLTGSVRKWNKAMDAYYNANGWAIPANPSQRAAAVSTMDASVYANQMLAYYAANNTRSTLDNYFADSKEDPVYGQVTDSDVSALAASYFYEHIFNIAFDSNLPVNAGRADLTIRAYSDGVLFPHKDTVIPAGERLTIVANMGLSGPDMGNAYQGCSFGCAFEVALQRTGGPPTTPTARPGSTPEPPTAPPSTDPTNTPSARPLTPIADVTPTATNTGGIDITPDPDNTNTPAPNTPNITQTPAKTPDGSIPVTGEDYFFFTLLGILLVALAAGLILWLYFKKRSHNRR